MSDKLGLEPAFPEMHDNSDANKYGQPGMSKRFYAACAAMQGLLSGRLISVATSDEVIVEISYKLSDELLKQENL